MNLTQILTDAEDRLFPALRLTSHERALYYHLLRHSRLVGRRAITRSKQQLADALDLAPTTIRNALRSLHRAGCIRIAARLGIHGLSLEVRLPDEALASAGFTQPSEILHGILLPSEIVHGCHSERSEESAFVSSEISTLKSAIAFSSPPLPPTTDHLSPSPACHAQRSEESAFVVPSEILPVCHPERSEGSPGFDLSTFQPLNRSTPPTSLPPNPSTFQPLNLSTCLPPKRGRARSTGRFRSKSLRAACFNREQARCFYCLRALREGAWSLDHVVPAAAGGDDSPHNAVAACHECNCRKGEMNAADFLRSLYRRGLLTATELESRLAALRALCAPAH